MLTLARRTFLIACLLAPGVALAADEPYLDAEKLDITRFLSPTHTVGSPEDLADRADFAAAKAELRAAYGL